MELEIGKMYIVTLESDDKPEEDGVTFRLIGEVAIPDEDLWKSIDKDHYNTGVDNVCGQFHFREPFLILGITFPEIMELSMSPERLILQSSPGNTITTLGYVMITCEKEYQHSEIGKQTWEEYEHHILWECIPNKS